VVAGVAEAAVKLSAISRQLSAISLRTRFANLWQPRSATVLLNIEIFAARDDSAPFAPPRASAKKLTAEG
jgi:hypothetical protein